MAPKDTMLADVCCGPCSLPLGDIYKDISDTPVNEIIFYVTDDNVHPYSEYAKRLDSIKKAALHFGKELVVEDYNSQEWFDLVRGMEDEPENGKRCILCYRYRLEKAAEYASRHGYRYFTTTLTTGPSKNAKIINKIGREIAQAYGLIFIEHDLKKKGGFLKSIVTSKQLGLYRQDYCGCIYSMMKRIEGNDKDDEPMTILRNQRKSIMASPKL